MSAQPCGCDPEAGWGCSLYPACLYGRWKQQEEVRRTMMGKLPGVDEHQPAPEANDRPAIQDLVIADLRRTTELTGDRSIPTAAFEQVAVDVEARKQIGLQRYGTLLQAFNGRDALMDAYQEALDLVQYLRQVHEEGRWVLVTYMNALRMALQLRTLIEDRANEAGSVTALGDPARGD